MRALFNRHNWQSASRLFRRVANPWTFLFSLIVPRRGAVIRVRTPIGPVRIAIRNRESVKTLFSIFCREDYLLPSSERYVVLDLGANIGIASAYFLSRNRDNRVIGVEPDPGNIPFLLDNMKQFGTRFEHQAVAVHTQAGTLDFYCSPDGKHSTACASEHRGWTKIEVPAVSFAELCRIAVDTPGELPVAIKIDVEGLEEALVRSVDFQAYPRIRRIIVESCVCSELVPRPHTRTLRSGYVEDLVF